MHTTTYYMRHLDIDGGLLRFSMFQCAGDGDAIHRASAEPLPAGCASVEVTTDNRCVWRGEADGFWDRAFAEEAAASPAEMGTPTP